MRPFPPTEDADPTLGSVPVRHPAFGPIQRSIAPIPLYYNSILDDVGLLFLTLAGMTAWVIKAGVFVASQGFIHDVPGEFARLGKPQWLLALLVVIILSVADFVYWSFGPNLTWADYAGLVVTAPAWFGVSYLASMSMISREPSGIGWLRFTAATLLLVSPILAALAGILILLPGPNRDAVLAVALPLLLIGWIATTVLPALPVAQALSPKPVSLLKALRGTKGHRWPLFAISLVAGSLNKIVPSTSTAKNASEAILLSVGNGLVSTMTMLFLASIGVTAWRYAVKNDKTLYGETPRA